MQPVFDLSTENLIQGFNFISKVCAAELGEINILSTDRIITSAMSGESKSMWNRILLSTDTDKDPELMRNGWKNCYRLFRSDAEISFIIFSTICKDPNYVYTFTRPKYTADQPIQMNIIIPDMSKLDSSLFNRAPDQEEPSYDELVYKLIRSIFRYFLFSNHDASAAGVGSFSISTNTLVKATNKYIEVLASLFTILTGLFREDFIPKNLDKNIIDLSREMTNDGDILTLARDGHMCISCLDETMIYYLDQLAVILSQ